MTIAVFAPLKPPDHPTPSGDRAMARALIAALQAGGYTVATPCDLRLYDGLGDIDKQDTLFATARDEVLRLVAHEDAKTWRAWLTYHNYYKAPDLVGPGVAQALGIPYLQVESTRARKRLAGPWARFAAAAEAASDAAHTIFYLTQRDAQTLQRDAPDGQTLRHLAPFLARTDLPNATTGTGAMLSVGMMRDGDKRASYALIAQALTGLPSTLHWQLDIAGDGPVRDKVAAMLAPFGCKVRLLGALDHATLQTHYETASLLLWPGVNEAFGLTYLEAQATGVPVVAQDRPGVRDVAYGPLCREEAGPPGLTRQLTRLLQDLPTRQSIGARARAKVEQHHLLNSASRTLHDTLEGLL